VSVGRDVIGAAESVVAVAVPETRLIKPALYALAALACICLLALGWWLLFGRARHAEVKAATAQVQAATSAGTAGAAQDAVKIITVHDREVERIQTITQGGVNAVQNASDARTSVPAVAASMRASLCMFGAYRADPGCAALPGTGEGVGPADADAASTTAHR
jgi:hypothetical protein